jgi:Xaa-Pro aminopeptidase
MEKKQLGMDFNLSEYMRGTYGRGLRLPDLSKKIPVEEFGKRVEMLREALGELGVDVAFAYGDERSPGDVGWLTGYHPHIESALVVVGRKKVLVLGGPCGEAYAKETMRTGEFRCLEELVIPGEDYPGVRFDKIDHVLREASGGAPKAIGNMTARDTVPVAVVDLMKEAVEAEVRDCSRWMVQARYRKSPAELSMMAIAAYISTWGMDAMLHSIEPGKRETECAAVAEYVMKSMGADTFGFNTIVCSGLRASNVLGRAGNKVIEDGDLVVLGTSARSEGMTAALGRTVVVGAKPHPDKIELIAHCVKAYESCKGSYKCGAPAKEVDLAARNHLRSVGLDGLHNTVHGIGWTECMEGSGEATQHSSYVFPKGIASQIDVGVFGRAFKSLSPAEVGVRVENPWVIDHEGNSCSLTYLPPDVNHIVYRG